MSVLLCGDIYYRYREWLLNTSVLLNNIIHTRIYYISFLLAYAIAVKFGRMSKKQREKVEDEVRYHRAQMKANQQAETSPDSSVFDNQQPSSSDQLAPYTGG